MMTLIYTFLYLYVYIKWIRWSPEGENCGQIGIKAIKWEIIKEHQNGKMSKVGTWQKFGSVGDILGIIHYVYMYIITYL